MIDFLKRLYDPAPFFTEQNTENTITYAKTHPEQYTEIYVSALKYVQAVLQDEVRESVTPIFDMRLVRAAYAAAETAHSKMLHIRDFISAVRWRYIMTAMRQYIDALRNMEE